MERRWSNRRSVNWPAVIEFGRAAPKLGAEIRNVGLEGVFIAVPELDGRRRGDDLRLSFVVQGCDEIAGSYSLDCRIVHAGPEGIGVYFNDFHSLLFRRLSAHLYARGEDRPLEGPPERLQAGRSAPTG